MPYIRELIDKPTFIDFVTEGALSLVPFKKKLGIDETYQQLRVINQGKRYHKYGFVCGAAVAVLSYETLAANTALVIYEAFLK